MPGTFIVIPCFNEALRFQASEAELLLAEQDVNLVLVNDGSTDQTSAVLSEFANGYTARVTCLDLPRNQGKAEAVRIGMQKAIAEGAETVGYLDGDFATPAKEMLRLVEVAASSQARVVFGARWLHLGAEIERSMWRHYGGRVFATVASLVLGLKVYDTQCGAKLFKVSPALEASLSDPFASKWAFDVELFGRLHHSYETGDFLEVPLKKWVDVAGSKMSLTEMIQATVTLFQIQRRLKNSDYSNFRGAHQGKNSGIS